jgi:glycosyltransferase involved in cell wall biosynthesis
MPAYNEEENIENVIAQWHPVLEKINNTHGMSKLVIANDGSKDKTYEIMQKLASQYSYFEPLSKRNSGHGSTLLYLYKKAIADHIDYIFQTDSDGQTDPDEFWQFWNNRHQYDFQIGKRKNRQDGLGRIFVTKVLKWVVWLMFHESVTDANTPFRLMKSNRLIPILKMIPEDFFLCNVAISAIVVKWKERCKWYPISFKSRQKGTNSINFKRIVKIGWKALSDFKVINDNLKNIQ